MSETTYDARLRLIHWASAVLFIVAMLIGCYCGLQAPGTSPRRELLEVHKSLGVILFFLAILRIMVRAATTAPPQPASFGPLVRLAARLNHWVLYAVLLAMPITGYLFSSAGGYSLKFFWLFSWPRLVSDSPSIAHAGEVSHDALAYPGLCRGRAAYHGDNLACCGQAGCDTVAHVARQIERIHGRAGYAGRGLSYCSRSGHMIKCSDEFQPSETRPRHLRL